MNEQAMDFPVGLLGNNANFPGSGRFKDYTIDMCPGCESF